MEDKRTISGEQVAILAERVDVLLANFSKMEGMLLTMAQQQSAATQQMAVLQERMTQTAENMRRLFNLSDQHGENIEKAQVRVEKIDKQLNVHSWAWKLFGTVAVLSLGLVGWTFRELQTLNKNIADQSAEIRLLNYMISNRTNGGPAPTKPPTNGNP